MYVSLHVEVAAPVDLHARILSCTPGVQGSSCCMFAQTAQADIVPVVWWWCEACLQYSKGLNTYLVQQYTTMKIVGELAIAGAKGSWQNYNNYST